MQLSYPSILYPGDTQSTTTIKKYLQSLGLSFQTAYDLDLPTFFERFYPLHPAFRNVAGEPDTPTLVVRYALNPYNGDAYISLQGALSFIRLAYTDKLFGEIDRFYEKAPFFFAHDHSDASPDVNLVACYGPDRRRIFTGNMQQAPHPLKNALDNYYYTNWHSVTSRHIGKPEELKEQEGVFVSPHSGDVLLKEDLEALANGKIITTQDYGDIYQVDYAALYKHENTIYGLYCHMLD